MVVMGSSWLHCTCFVSKLGAHMSETASRNLSGVAETLLIPLYSRARESRRPDALIKDGKAVELVMRMSLDFSRARQIPLSEE